ncbi:MAG: putative tRNA sulfurtransferase [Parcubacteria group bacterium GW2011_GWC2_39_14]|nr:MAG: putative tRNA sulfurtransferase [Parcubacteria group bacterium GW2011_GWC2_39_14]KKR55163.1 MAG: putative tRNA sulfurtransferase [Parcubacteria group bacterium GW2011_GWA2_40_23]
MNTIFNAIIVHFDEIGLKGKNQKFFVRRLVENVSQKLKTDVKIGAKKLVVSWPKNKSWDQIASLLNIIPGIAFFAPATICASKLEDIKINSKKVIEFYKPQSFRFTARRADKSFEMDSLELSRELGSVVLDAFPDLKVNLKTADIDVRVEVDKESTAILGQQEQGIGGLPVGTTGEVLCLLSGGFDSPVAAYLMMKRGAHVNFIHFQNQTINKSGVEDKIKDLVKILSLVQGESKLLIVPFADLQKEVIKSVDSKVRMIVYRRLMYKIAERVAKQNKALALVTGDSLGQVASQTLENMSVIASATSMLKLAPLSGTNKIEIINLAQKIGTYDISVRPYGDCCNLLVALHPETSARIQDIERAESKIDFQPLIESAINKIQTFTF